MPKAIDEIKRKLGFQKLIESLMDINATVEWMLKEFKDDPATPRTWPSYARTSLTVGPHPEPGPLGRSPCRPRPLSGKRCGSQRPRTETHRTTRGILSGSSTTASGKCYATN